MPDVASFILTSLLSVLAFAIGRCDSRHSPRQVQGLAAFILMVLIAKAFLHAHPAWEAQLLPWREYAALQSYWIWPLALCFFGLIAGHLPRRSTGRSVAVALAALVFATSLWSQRWMVVGIDDRSTAVADRDHHCVQSAGDSCVPASCVSLLSYWGVPAIEGEMARLCISQGGTSLFNAYRGLRLKADDHGLRAHRRDRCRWRRRAGRSAAVRRWLARPRPGPRTRPAGGPRSGAIPCGGLVARAHRPPSARRGRGRRIDARRAAGDAGGRGRRD